MAGADFEAVKPMLKISSDRINAARAALVDGRTWQSIADDYGWTRQNVGKAVSVVWRMFEIFQQSQKAANDAGAAKVPRGWKRITLIAPRELIKKIQSEIAEAAPCAVKQPGAKATKRK